MDWSRIVVDSCPLDGTRCWGVKVNVDDFGVGCWFGYVGFMLSALPGRGCRLFGVVVDDLSHAFQSPFWAFALSGFCNILEALEKFGGI